MILLLSFRPFLFFSAQKSIQDSPMTGGQLAGTPVTPAAGADRGVIFGDNGDQNQEENPSFLANLATADASTGIHLTHHTTPFIAVLAGLIFLAILSFSC